MHLRLQINVIIGSLLAIFASLLIVLQLSHTRDSVHDEMEGGSVVATQLLSRLKATIANSSLEETRHFLSLIGRIRANEVELQDLQGRVVYHSPPPVYKAGRDAPNWYSAIVSPEIKTKTIEINQGLILVRSDPSRAVLDGWDTFLPMLSTIVAGFFIGNIVVYFLVGRVLDPIAKVIQALQAMAQGDYGTRLSPMRGQEARLMGEAFNTMAQSVQDGIADRERVRETAQALAQNRELTKVIQTRIEEVRGQIARELHDELGQQVTAIKSVGLSISHRAKGLDAQIESSATMVVRCADAIYDEVHRLVTQLRPLALDCFGLRDALNDLWADARARNPGIAIELTIESSLEGLSDELSTAVYRIMQESLTNALRHAQASQIDMVVHTEGPYLQLEIRDNGKGPSPHWQDIGHFGVLGMGERAQGLGGTLIFEALQPHGARVLALLPLTA